MKERPIVFESSLSRAFEADEPLELISHVKATGHLGYDQREVCTWGPDHDDVFLTQIVLVQLVCLDCGRRFRGWIR